MTKNQICLLMLAATIAAPSCKKKHDNPGPLLPPPTDTTVNISYDNYTMLKPGNYWIYQNYALDSASGEAHALGTYDSSYVEKDTLIGKHVYHKYQSEILQFGSLPPEYKTEYLRDSMSYIVNIDGRVIFSSEDFTTIFRSYIFGPNAVTNDTILVTEQMGFRGETTIVEAGAFTTSSFRIIYNFPASTPGARTKEYTYRYARNIGLVRETTGFYFGAPNVYERRLARYHVRRKL